MSSDLWSLYSHMFQSRLFEEAITKLWHEGLISGEMHLGTGEEAINAGIVSQLKEGDAMALDHRGTAALLIRGVDPLLILRELLGCGDGLCGGMGGHMHLFSKDYLAASSGIVGASGPAAAGFALSAKHLRPGSIAVAFFGEGAMNQGMLMESMNLASVWNLPVLFVCKDDNWSITTKSSAMTGGNLNARAKAFGIPAVDVDGTDVSVVWEAANSATTDMRSGKGPAFMHATCVRPEGHFLGLQLLRIARDPLREMPGVAVPLTQSFLTPGGAGIKDRIKGLKSVLDAVICTMRDPRKDDSNDPVIKTRTVLKADQERLIELENRIQKEVDVVLDSALEGVLS